MMLFSSKKRLTGGETPSSPVTRSINPLRQHDYENYDYERECNQQREKY